MSNNSKSVRFGIFLSMMRERFGCSSLINTSCLSEVAEVHKSVPRSIESTRSAERCLIPAIGVSLGQVGTKMKTNTRKLHLAQGWEAVSLALWSFDPLNGFIVVER